MLPEITHHENKTLQQLTFNDQVNIVQLKIIQSKMKELGRICGSAEIVSECQLNVHFHEVEETWKALQWIYNNENQEQGLRYALLTI